MANTKTESERAIDTTSARLTCIRVTREPISAPFILAPEGNSKVRRLMTVEMAGSSPPLFGRSEAFEELIPKTKVFVFLHIRPVAS